MLPRIYIQMDSPAAAVPSTKSLGTMADKPAENTRIVRANIYAFYIHHGWQSHGLALPANILSPIYHNIG